jgi:Flp pilus assembly protein TadD
MQLRAALSRENALRIFRALVTLLLLVVNRHLCDAAHGESIISAPSPLPKSLCGGRTDTDTRPHVLLGRFSLFGEFEPNVRASLDELVVRIVEWGLLQQLDVMAFRTKIDLIDLQRFKGLPVLIDEAFNVSAATGKPAPVSTTDPSSKTLLEGLKDNNCDYLFGGRITRAGILINIEPYLLDVRSKEILRPFPPSNGDAQSVVRISELFAEQLGVFLRERGRLAQRRRLIDVTCFVWPDSLLLFSIRSVADQFSTLMRTQIISSLASGKRFPVRPLGGKESSCEPATSDISPDVAAVIEGRIRLEGVSSLEIRPSVRLLVPPYEVALAPIRYPVTPVSGSLIAKIPSDFAERIDDFLIAVTRDDGTFPNPAPALSADGKDEQAALAAYSELARNQANAQANFVLGRVFQEKQEFERALRYFLAANAARESLPVNVQARLSEALGDTSKDPAEQRKYYDAAQDLYRSAKNNDGVHRANRGIARLLYFDGKKKEGIQALQNQPDLERDYESLQLLGFFLILSGQESEAIKFLLTASHLQPTDEETNNLLADSYERLGRKAYAAKQPIDARENFGLALTYRETQSLLYLAGLSAYDLGDYRDAMTQLEKAVRLPADKSSFKLTEASWLTLLECYLLFGDYVALEARGQDASSFLRWIEDSRLVADYLRVVGSVITNWYQGIPEFKKEAAYREIESASSEASAKNLRWNNEKVEMYIARKVSDPEKTNFLADLKQRVWRDPTPLK